MRRTRPRTSVVPVRALSHGTSPWHRRPAAAITSPERAEPPVRRTPRSLRVAALTVAAALATVVAGCSSGPSDAAVTWAGGLCSAMSDFSKAAKDAPPTDQNAQSIDVQKYVDYFNKLGTASQKSIDELKALGPAPVDGGDAAITELNTSLTSVKQTFDSTATKLAGTDASDASAVRDVLTQVQTDLKSKPLFNLSAVGSNKDLDAAVGKAPSCQSLQNAQG